MGPAEGKTAGLGGKEWVPGSPGDAEEHGAELKGRAAL